MAGIFSNFFQQALTGPNVRDYRHGQRTFVDSLYRLSPKYTTLFHVFFDLNPTVANVTQNEQVEIGMMAKTAQLPKFSISQKTYNAYNRKNIAQEKINYDPVRFTLHDDSADVVRNFWYDYYSYYYRDSDYQEELYRMQHKYSLRQQKTWGFSPKSDQPYLSAIRIYSLHQKQFSAYNLINPIITDFSHGEHQQGSNEVMQHELTIAYEAVQYAYGAVTNGTVQGFNVMHYDNQPSPLSSLGGGTTSILGPGGLIDTFGGTITNLNNGNYAGAALTALRGAQSWKGADLKAVLAGEAMQVGKNILRGSNPTSPFFVPTASSITNAFAKAPTARPESDTNTNGIPNINSQNSFGIF
jgi:hypothetical protein